MTNGLCAGSDNIGLLDRKLIIENIFMAIIFYNYGRGASILIHMNRCQYTMMVVCINTGMEEECLLIVTELLD